MSLNIALEILGGSITGYLTNKIAVKMLFKEYFGFGGVILKTKEDFIKNVSELVETDLINHKTIESEFVDSKFDPIFLESSNEILESLQLQNFNVYDFFSTEDMKNFYNFFHLNNKKYSVKITNSILEKTKYSELINEKLETQIIEKLIENLIKKTKNNEVSQLGILIDENKEMRLDEILETDVIEDIKAEVLKTLSIKDSSYLTNTSSNIVEKYLKNPDFNELIHKFFELQILDLASEETKKKIADTITITLKGYKDSKQYKQLKENICFKIKEIDMSVYDLFDASIDLEINKFIDNNYEDVIAKGKLKIREHKDEIESLMELSIDEKIVDSPNDMFNMKSKVRESIKSALFGANKKIDICDQIEDFIDNQINEDLMKEGLFNKIKEYLNKSKFNEYNLNQNIDSILDSTIDEFMEALDEQKISSLVNFEVKDLLPKDKEISMILKEAVVKYFADIDRVNSNLELILEQIFEKIKVLKLGVVSETFNIDILELENDFIKRTITINKDKIKDLIQNMVLKNFKNKTLSEILDDASKKEIVKNFEFEIEQVLESKYESFKKSNINQFFKKEETKKLVALNMSKMLRKMTIDNLSIAMEGNISSIVSKKLKEMNDENLLEIVEEFMGKELKPINTFGAILGGIAGLGLYFYKSKYALDFEVENYITSFLVYGGIGWLTNFIALKMIFRPYKDIEISGQTIFPSGVVVRQKSRFAQNMGKFVGEKLLNLDKDFKINEEKKKTFISAVKSMLSKDNYFYLNNYLLSNKYKISEALSNLTKNKAKDLLDSIKEKSSNQLKEMEVKSFIKERKDDKNFINDYILKNSEVKMDIDNDAKIGDFIDLDKISNLDLSFEKKAFEIEKLEDLKIISEEKYNSYLGDFIRLNDLINKQDLMNILVDYIDDKIKQNLSTRPLKEIDPIKEAIKTNCENLTKDMPRYLVEYIESNKGNVSNLIIDRVKVEFGMMYILAGSFLDLDQIIIDVMDDFLGVKLTNYIKENKNKLRREIGFEISQIILDHKIEKDHLNIDKNRLKNNLDKINFFDDVILQEIKYFDQEINSISLKEILNQDDLLIKNIITRSNQDKKLIEDTIKDFVKDFIGEIKKSIGKNLLELKIKDLDLEITLNRIFTKEKGHELFSELKDRKFKSLLRKIETMTIDEILSKEAFNMIFEEIGDSFKNEDKYKFVSEIYCDILENINNTLGKETKENILDYILKTLVGVFENRENSILKNLNINHVVQREINLMHPSEIENLFNSFASKYFRRLELYGISGGVFGIIVLIITSLF